MNHRLIFKSIGNILRIEALLMLFPLAVSLIYGGKDYWAFLWSALITVSAGTLLVILKPKDKNFRTRDAFVVAGLSWVFLSLFGALPVCFSGYFSSFIDCIFESVSVLNQVLLLTNIEVLPKGILFWRSFYIRSAAWNSDFFYGNYTSNASLVNC